MAPINLVVNGDEEIRNWRIPPPIGACSSLPSITYKIINDKTRLTSWSGQYQFSNTHMTTRVASLEFFMGSMNPGFHNTLFGFLVPHWHMDYWVTVK